MQLMQRCLRCFLPRCVRSAANLPVRARESDSMWRGMSVRTRVVFHSCGFFTTSTARGGLHKVASVSRCGAVCCIAALFYCCTSHSRILGCNNVRCSSTQLHRPSRTVGDRQGMSVGPWRIAPRMANLRHASFVFVYRICREKSRETDRYRPPRVDGLPLSLPPHPIPSIRPSVRARAASQAHPRPAPYRQHLLGPALTTVSLNSLRRDPARR